jgi:hypothetical protein
MVHYSEASPAFAHPLRLAILVSYPVAFALCIAGSEISRSPVPGLGLLPFSFSALLSAVTLLIARHHRRKRVQLPAHDDDPKKEGKAPLLLSPIAIFAYDVILATFLMVVLLFTWDNPPYVRSWVVLNTYATVPLLLGHVSHIYLALLALLKAFQSALRREAPTITCPNCNTHIESSWFNRGQHRHGGYSALGEEDSEQYTDGMQEQMSARKNVIEPPAADNEEMAQPKGKGLAEEASISPDPVHE